MSDFLARLAGRALGVTPIVKPVIDPAFAAFPSTGLHRHSSAVAAPDVDPGPAAATAAAPPGRERGPDDSTPAPIEESAQEDVRRQDEGFERLQPRRPRGEDAPAALASVSSDATTARHEFVVDDTSPAIVPTGTFDNIPLHHASPTGERVASSPAPDGITARNTLPEPGQNASYGLIAAPRSFAQRPQRRFQPQAAAAEAPQVVRITIGRIDVRAEAPSPPPARAASRKQENRGLSLDDYLKQRAEGRR
jgi:hypothetical protein